LGSLEVWKDFRGIGLGSRGQVMNGPDKPGQVIRSGFSDGEPGGRQINGRTGMDAAGTPIPQISA
jgi:hypothetical protein